VVYLLACSLLRRLAFTCIEIADLAAGRVSANQLPVRVLGVGRGAIARFEGDVPSFPRPPARVAQKGWTRGRKGSGAE